MREVLTRTLTAEGGDCEEACPPMFVGFCLSFTPVCVGHAGRLMKTEANCSNLGV